MPRENPRVPQTITLALSTREGVRLRARDLEIPVSRYIENLILSDLEDSNHADAPAN